MRDRNGVERCCEQLAKSRMIGGMFQDPDGQYIMNPSNVLDSERIKYCPFCGSKLKGADNDR